MMDERATPRSLRAASGWRAWRNVLGALIAIPVIFAALWGVSVAIAWLIPGCDFFDVYRSCVVGGINIDPLLALLTFPAALLFFTILFPIWILFTFVLLLYGLVSVGISWMIGAGFTLPPASMLQGSALRVPRVVAVLVLFGLFAWWWIATL